MRQRRWLALASLCLLATARAGPELAHELAPGETLDSVAELYYDEPSWGESLGLYNGLEPGEPPVGERLRIPLSTLREVASGDSWLSLARAHWAEESLAGELAELSLGAREHLEPGTRLLIPALVPYRVQPGETLASISRRVYGSPERAVAIARLNGLADADRIAAGRILRVPLFSNPPRPEVSGNGALPPPTAPDDQFAAALRASFSAYERGDFEIALEALELLRPQVLERGSSRERVELLRQLTILYVAFDRSREACGSYRGLLSTEPRWTWDPVLVSPKVIRMTRGC